MSRNLREAEKLAVIDWNKQGVYELTLQDWVVHQLWEQRGYFGQGNDNEVKFYVPKSPKQGNYNIPKIVRPKEAIIEFSMAHWAN